jgi:hypothetical protein
MGANASRLGDYRVRLGLGIGAVRAAHLIRARRRVVRLPSKFQHGVFMADNSMTGTFQLKLPKDLLLEAQRAAKKPTNDLRVEGWRTSWMTRLSELFVGKD